MKTIVALLIIIAAFVGYNSIFIVEEGKQAIITQFGEPIRGTFTNAGLYFKIPMVQKVHMFEKRILKWDGDPNEIPTKDKKYIWIDTTARWQIINPLHFLQRMGNERNATLLLNDLINGSVRDLVTKNDLVEIIRSSDWDVKYTMTEEVTSLETEVIKVGRDRFSNLVLKDVAAVTREKNYGIKLLDVMVKRINYTTQVRNKVYARMISERNRIASRIRSEGEAEKAEILGDMEKKLKDIESSAFRKAEKTRGDADAEATKISGMAYNKDPEFYEFFMTLKNYKSLMGPNTKLVINADSPVYKHLKVFKRNK